MSSSAGPQPNAGFAPGTFVSEQKPAEWVQHRLTGLIKLMEITRGLAAETELDPILRLITDGACQALECERASLFLYDEARRELYTRVVTELEIREIRMSIEGGINGWVGRNKKLLNVADPQFDPRWNPCVDKETGFQTRSILAAPLISPRDERLLGTIELLNRRNDEAFDRADENLLEAFAAHAAVSLERVELLENYRKTRELELSLEAARSVQARFLPDKLPQISGYELSAWWQPAFAVGGDYYDAFQFPDGRVGLAVADVSGHGLGPSLIMASVRAMLHVLSRTLSQPARILSLLNETIAPDLHWGQFITMLLGALDPRTHQFHFANAGHGPALHLDRQTGKLRSLTATGIPLGIPAGDLVESSHPVLMGPGDLVILATDGVVEIRNKAGELYGRKRFEELILANQTLPATELITVIRDALMRFDAGSPPDDDITILILERKLA